MNDLPFMLVLAALTVMAIIGGVLAIASWLCGDITDDPEDFLTVESRKPAPMPGMTDRDLAEWEARNNVPAHQRSFPAGEPQ